MLLTCICVKQYLMITNRVLLHQIFVLIMKRKINKSLLRKTICLVVLFIAYPFLQINIYSSENHKIKRGKPKANFISVFGEYNRDLLVNPFTYNHYYELPAKEKNNTPTIKIYSQGLLDELQLAKFLNTYNPKIAFLEAKHLAANYIKHCKVEGINHDIAFAQMCLETAYLKYGGSVSSHQNNFCGLGAVNNQCEGDSFKTKEIGIIAHIQHLKAYVSKDDLNSILVDSRFKYVQRGSVDTVHDLTGKWATDPKYGEKIEKLLHRMYSI